jgi:hypothetical protein
MSDEQRARIEREVDGTGPFRNIVGFLGLLLVGKALPDAVFSVLRHMAGIRGAEVLDTGMLTLDAVLVVVGVGLLYTAIVLMGPPPIPDELLDAEEEDEDMIVLATDRKVV